MMVDVGIVMIMIMVGILNCVFVDVFVVDFDVVVFGEDVGVFGGVFWIIDGFIVCFGEDCCFDILLVEFGIVGIVVGMVMNGLWLVVEM